ncbi:MAG: hypothetical protein MZV63_33005 [Marinilabiliales bacterium]|nr:hypothetical protein [Marinilabiliales bacterium]
MTGNAVTKTPWNSSQPCCSHSTCAVQYTRPLRPRHVHVAYVSHISHITSFALALCVLDKEKDYTNIMSLARGRVRKHRCASRKAAETRGHRSSSAAPGRYLR